MSDAQDPPEAERAYASLPLTLQDDKGAPLDEHALAHNVTLKGFRVETQVDLAPGQIVLCRLSLSSEQDLRGRAKVVWAKRTDVTLWADVEFLGLGWSEKRQLKRLLRPPLADWAAVSLKGFLAVVWTGILLAAWYGLSSPFWRQFIFWLAPRAFAVLALGWALRVLLHGD